MVNIPDQRPGCNIIIGRCDHIIISLVDFTGVSWIRCFGIDWFNDIIGSVKGFIPDQLDLRGPVLQLFHYEYCDILLFIAIQGSTQNDGMYIFFHIVRNRYIIDEVITV